MKLTYDRPATKAQAYDLITCLKLGGELSEAEIDSLLLYFCPPKPKVAKTAMEWVARAVAEKDLREYLTYLYVRDGYAIGTNGHFIHRAKVDTANGFYCPKTLL